MQPKQTHIYALYRCSLQLFATIVGISCLTLNWWLNFRKWWMVLKPNIIQYIYKNLSKIIID